MLLLTTKKTEKKKIKIQAQHQLRCTQRAQTFKIKIFKFFFHCFLNDLQGKKMMMYLGKMILSINIIISCFGAAVSVSGFLVLPAVKIDPRIRYQLLQQPSQQQQQQITSFSYQEEDAAAQRWIPTYTMGGGEEPPARYALDVCCGTGDSTSDLISRLYSFEWKVLGVDEDPVKIALAKKKHPGLQFLAGSLEIFPSGSFDRIQLSTGRLLFIKNKWKLVKELARLLKPGGTLEVFDYPLCHPFIQEVMGIEEDARERYFCGWRNYDPRLHHMLFSEILDSLGYSVCRGGQGDQEDIVCATFRKY